MNIDGIVLNSITDELSKKLINGRVQKINHINKNLIIINIYNNKNYKLLLSSDSQSPRVHITEKEFSNPLKPSNFCMVLRKNLNNSKLISISQNDLDRTITLTFNSKNELGMDTQKRLVVDLMGKHSNIVLLDESDKVIESIVRVSFDMSSVRPVYPGTTYKSLPSDKMSILEDNLDISTFNYEEKTPVFKIFYMNILGFSPVISREICYLSDIDPKINMGSISDESLRILQENLNMISDRIRNKSYEPFYRTENNIISDFYCFNLKHLKLEKYKNESISSLLDNYFETTTNDDSLNQSRKSLEDQIKSIISKKSNKLDLMRHDKEKAKDYDTYRVQGELLQSNVYSIEKGAKEINLLNYYTNEMVTIGLDQRKTAWQNIELKYKQAKKFKKAFGLYEKSIPLVEDELKYLINLQNQLKAIDNHSELTEIKEELYEGGYIKTVGRSKKKKDKPSSPHVFETDDKSIIYVGKNNIQNEKITLREAAKNDLFFHIKDLPGSHVIMKNPSGIFSDKDIQIAAYLAGLYSKYSDENYLDIDYTEKKNVYKAKGSKPGMVYYNNFKTIRVNLNDKPDGFFRK